MSNLVKLTPPNPLPPDLPEKLRELADRVEAGKVTAMTATFLEDGYYNYLWPSSLTESLIMATLAQAQALDRYRA